MKYKVPFHISGALPLCLLCLFTLPPAVVLLPPCGGTWWARSSYILLLLTLVWFVFRAVRHRLHRQEKLRLQALEKVRIEAQNQAKLQYFTNITHELLTPVTIISAAVEELKASAAGYEHLCAMMSANTGRLHHLLQQLLEFRKAEAGNLQLRVSLGDIAAFVKHEADAFHPFLKSRQIDLSVRCHPGEITGYFDTDKVDKILYNLLSNAAKYNRAGGLVQVTLTYADNFDSVRLSVKDNGPGIPKAKQAHLFKRFYEGDYRRYNTTGNGIGLSLVKELVALHQGTIHVESDEGQGAEFIVILPIDRASFSKAQIDRAHNVPTSAELPDAVVNTDRAHTVPTSAELPDAVVNADRAHTVPTSAELPEAAPTTQNEEAHTLLLVEDNEDLLHLMATLLRRDYHVLTARNGQEAVALVENEEVDLIVSDIKMPLMDGIALCRYIKTNVALSHIPILLLTAKHTADDRAEAYEAGADAYLSKPFRLNVLHARIRNLLQARWRAASRFKHQLVLELSCLHYTDLDEDFLQRAIACVNRHLDDGDFDQTRFVYEMGTSKSTLYKKLKALTGLNTSAFIRNIRLKAACSIMEEKGATARVSDLAYAVGFNDPKYFSTCFKKEFGILPTDYLERFTAR